MLRSSSHRLLVCVALPTWLLVSAAGRAEASEPLPEVPRIVLPESAGAPPSAEAKSEQRADLSSRARLDEAAETEAQATWAAASTKREEVATATTLKNKAWVLMIGGPLVAVGGTAIVLLTAKDVSNDSPAKLGLIGLTVVAGGVAFALGLARYLRPIEPWTPPPAPVSRYRSAIEDGTRPGATLGAVRTELALSLPVIARSF